ncbi:MAG: MFS transporter [Blastocatellia bacterium]
MKVTGITAKPSVSSSERKTVQTYTVARWWLLTLLITGMALCFAQRAALNIAAPMMIKEMGYSPALMGVLLSAFGWTYALGQAPSGWLADRYGFRRVYAYGFMLWSIATSALGLARQAVVLVLLRMGVGLGQATIFPASARAVTLGFPEQERGLATSGFISGNRLGVAVMNGLGTILLVAVGWKSFFLLTGLVPLLWLGLWWRQAEPQTPATTQTQHNLSFSESLRLLRHRSMLGVVIGFFTYDYSWFLLLNWLPGYLALERKFSTREMAVYSSVPYLVSFFVSLGTGMVSDWFVRRGYNELRVRRNITVLGMGIACAMVPASWVDNKMLAVWLLTVAVGGLSIAAPMAWALTQTICDKRVGGTAAGVQNCSGNIAGILAPMVTGFIAHSTGSFALALSVAGGLLVIGMLAYGLLVADRVTL